jgi:hypothetical protein
VAPVGQQVRNKFRYSRYSIYCAAHMPSLEASDLWCGVTLVSRIILAGTITRGRKIKVLAQVDAWAKKREKEKTVAVKWYVRDQGKTGCSGSE